MNHREIEKILKALGNLRRLAIVVYLKRIREANVGTIAHEIELSFRSTSRHLILLERAKILTRDQRGLDVFYRLAAGIPFFALNIIREL